MHPETAFDDADLNGFVDGRIDPARGAVLAESLASDPAARARVEAWRRQTETLRTMFVGVLTEPVPVRLLPVAVPARSSASGPARRPGRRIAGAVASTSVGMALVGFALGVLASVGTDGFGLAPSGLRGPDPTDRALPIASEPRDLARRAVEAHRTFLTDATHAAEVAAGDEAKLLRWFRHRLGASPRLPDLARQGWTFLGGRIVPGRHGPAAFLAYGSGAERLGLLVTRDPGRGDGRVTDVEDGDDPLGVATWDDGAFGFALTSDRGRDWLNRAVGNLRAGVKAEVDGDAPPP